MRRRVGVEDKSRFSINDISLGEDLGWCDACSLFPESKVQQDTLDYCGLVDKRDNPHLL